MAQYLVVEIERRIKTLNEKLIKRPISSPTLEKLIEENKKVLSFLDTLEAKEINTWHPQKNEDIYDAVKDWNLHVFVCLMDDGTVQKIYWNTL